MTTRSRIIVPRVTIALICLTLLLLMGVSACNNSITPTPLPFSFIKEPPNGEFLFIFVGDESSCIDDLCACPVSEPPAFPFEFKDGKLILNQYAFAEVPTDWISLRESSNAIALYGDYSLWNDQFQTFSSYPIATPKGGFTILGVDLHGDIQVMANGAYEIIPDGSYTNSTSPEQVSDECRVLHVYRLENYGFIKDESVEFLFKE